MLRPHVVLHGSPLDVGAERITRRDARWRATLVRCARPQTSMPERRAGLPRTMASISPSGTPANCLSIHSCENGNDPSLWGIVVAPQQAVEARDVAVADRDGIPSMDAGVRLALQIDARRRVDLRSGRCWAPMPRSWRRLSFQWWSKNCIANPSHPAYPSVMTRCRSGYFSNKNIAPFGGQTIRVSLPFRSTASTRRRRRCRDRPRPAGSGWGAARAPATCMVNGTFKLFATSHSGSHSARRYGRSKMPSGKATPGAVPWPRRVEFFHRGSDVSGTGAGFRARLDRGMASTSPPASR